MEREPTLMEHRVATALCAASHNYPGKTLIDLDPTYRAALLADARVAIRAMYEPTTKMMQAPRTKSIRHAIDCYQAMIDAASPSLVSS